MIRVGDIDRAFATRMLKFTGSPAHLIDKMNQRHTPCPAGCKQNRVFADRDASLPRRRLAATRIGSLEIDIETVERYHAIGERGTHSSHIETPDCWPGGRWTRYDRGIFNEVGLERIVIVRLERFNTSCGSGSSHGMRNEL